jgi:hypothetical protein
MRVRALLGAVLLIAVIGVPGNLEAAKVSSVSVLDRDYLVVHVLDGEVVHNEGVGETVRRFTPELDAAAAVQTGSWTLMSADDASYGSAGQHPLACHRKKKLSGHAQMEWVDASGDYRYEYTYQHWIYLKLPSPLQQGASYTLEIAPAVNGDVATASLTFDVFKTRSEAVHVNLVGYAPDAAHKAADLYHWMGDGGARSYSAFVGNTVYVYDVEAEQAYPAGQVAYWKPGGLDVFWYNFTRSPVWRADFDFDGPGTYRLVIDGVGSSQDFRIARDVYAEPFRVSLRGFFYMRVGQESATGIQPPPRSPLFLPGVSPPTTTVYLTDMQPWHPDWSAFTNGDPWDQPDKWAPYRKAGNPTNPNAWGGHADAADWDRHLGHVSIIYDMLLPYILTGGAIGDDATGIAESGNGIPDLLDEARNEVDFWLRLRDGEGYSHGLTNPNRSTNELYQAGPTAMAAWANAANAAMLADGFRVAGLTRLMVSYRDAAIAAYAHASGLANQMLDQAQNVGDSKIRGRDLKMTAAAFLYNVTGDQVWEAVVNAESVCASGPAELENGNRNQVWATAGYLLTQRRVNYPTLWADMKAAVTDEARRKEASLSGVRPSRRATDDRTGYFRTAQNVQRTMIAHAVAESAADEEYFHKALALEADWGLGRNPLNYIEMSTAWTSLASKRSIESMYTSGLDDGVAGVHPGHTPYLNLDDWYPAMVMGTPSRLYENGYPADFKKTWPVAEGCFDSPWVWAHSEFTPQQTMRGKTALYAYLYGLGGAPPPAHVLAVAKSGTGVGSVVSTPPGIDCGGDCSEAFPEGTIVTLTPTAAAGCTFAGWSGACSGTGPCELTMSAAHSVAATFGGVSSRGVYGNGGAPWVIGSTGKTRIQAENYDVGGEGVGYHDVDPANNGRVYRTDAVDLERTSDYGGGYAVAWVAAGEWLEYSVDVAAAGIYDLVLRVSRQASGESAVSVSLGGVDRSGQLAVPSTGSWQTWTDVVKKGVFLPSGPQTLRISMVGAGFKVNWIEIAKPEPRGTYGNNGAPWPIAPTGATRIQAEDYDTGGEGNAYHDTDSVNQGQLYRTDGVDLQSASDAGGGYKVGFVAAGEWLEYTVDVATAGTYDLKLRVSRQPAGASAASVSFGEVNKTGTMAVPSTGSFQTWTGLTKAGIGLSAGLQRLRLSMVGASFHVNWIELTKVASPPRYVIYADALATDWGNWSWSATVKLAGTAPVSVGTRAINVTLQGWGGLSLRKGAALATTGYSVLKFAVHGGTGSDKLLQVSTQTADSDGVSTTVPVTAVANAWTEVTVPLSSLGNPPSIKRLNIQSLTADTLPMVTFDDIRLE